MIRATRDERANTYQVCGADGRPALTMLGPVHRGADGSRQPMSDEVDAALQEALCRAVTEVEPRARALHPEAGISLSISHIGRDWYCWTNVHLPDAEERDTSIEL